MAISVRQTANTLSTSGLAQFNQQEIQLMLRDEDRRSDGEELLKYVSDYIATSGAMIRQNETIAYGYWLVKFVSAPGDMLDVWEYNANATEFVQGARLALACWREQHEVCARFGATFVPPRPDQLVVVSQGVFEGAAVKGVRYPSPVHMSGWWLVTDQYDGNVSSMREEHLYHLSASRPDLIRYLALPYGYRFDVSSEEFVWLDREVLDGSHPSQ